MANRKIQIKDATGVDNLYPVTRPKYITDASGATLDKIVNEINVSAAFPNGGSDGGNTYTIATAIAKVPTEMRNKGLRVTFISNGSDTDLTSGEVYTYQYVGSLWDANNFQIISNGIENTLNSSATDKSLAAAQGKVIKSHLDHIIPDTLSPNLVDISKVTSARFTDKNGSIQSFSSGGYYDYWRMTDYIDVSSHIGEYISITNHNGYCFYDSSKAAISGSGESLGMSYPANSSTEPILIPSGASFVRLVYWYRDTAVDTPMANFGTTLEEYSEYNSLRFPDKMIFNRNLGEKIEYGNIQHSRAVEYITTNNLFADTTFKDNYGTDNNTGEEITISSGYSESLTGYVEVKGGETYFGTIKKAAYYDSDKSYLGYVNTSNTWKFTAPPACKYVRCQVYQNLTNSPYHFQTQYLIEGTSIPDTVDAFSKYVSKNDIESKALYRTVLNRLKSLKNATVPTRISIFGDSNTYGLESGSTGRRITNCWANLLCNKVTDAYDKEVNIYPWEQYGTWCTTDYSRTAILDRKDCHYIDLDFYGSVFKIIFGNTVTGVASISIDGEAGISHDTSQNLIFEATGLTETYHKVRITNVSGRLQVNYITVKKYVTITNNGVVGIGSSSAPITLQDYDIYIMVIGTNDRGGGNEGNFRRNIINSVNTQEYYGKEVILITPTPATDTFETGVSSGLKMADIDRLTMDICAYLNVEPLSFYQFLLNYCRNTGTELNSLLNDTLHLSETAHRLLFEYLCDKLGLGQPIDTYLPT